MLEITCISIFISRRLFRSVPFSLSRIVGVSLEAGLKGFVYFIGAKDSERIKIGYSIDPWKRIQQIQSGNPENLEVLYHFPGTKETEATLHSLFGPSRLRGEWFGNAECIRWVAEHLRASQVAKALKNVGLEKWPEDKAALQRVLDAYDRFPVTVGQIEMAGRKVFPTDDAGAVPAPENLLGLLFGKQAETVAA
jgi:hypothetical protein